MVRTSWALLLALPLLSSLAAADGRTTYRWVDEKGRVHYSDLPAPATKAEEIQVKPGSGSGKPTAGTRAASDQQAKECERLTGQIAAYEAASGISETDGLGNTRNYSAAEKAKLVERTRAQMAEVCAR